MRITKPGVPLDELEWFGNCIACGAEVIAVQSELTGIVYDEDRGLVALQCCPGCGFGEDGKSGVLFRRRTKRPGRKFSSPVVMYATVPKDMRRLERHATYSPEERCEAATKPWSYGEGKGVLWGRCLREKACGDTICAQHRKQAHAVGIQEWAEVAIDGEEHRP